MPNNIPNVDKIPYGYCHCGCGQRTKISKYNDKTNGYVANEPRRFISGHNHRGKKAPRKFCTVCHIEKEATPEFFHRDKRAYDGLMSSCKECENKASRNSYGKYYADNKEGLIEKSRRWYHEHKQKAAERAKRYSKENKKKVADKKGEWRENNKEKIAEYNRNWWDKNPEKRKEHKSKRRSLKKSAQGNHTAGDIKSQYKRQNGKCYYCGKKVNDSYHVDHVIPLSRGGSNGPENIVISCQFCNQSKKDKMPHEWGGSNRLL